MASLPWFAIPPCQILSRQRKLSPCPFRLLHHLPFPGAHKTLASPFPAKHRSNPSSSTSFRLDIRKHPPPRTTHWTVDGGFGRWGRWRGIQWRSQCQRMPGCTHFFFSAREECECTKPCGNIMNNHHHHINKCDLCRGKLSNAYLEQSWATNASASGQQAHWWYMLDIVWCVCSILHYPEIIAISCNLRGWLQRN